MQGDIIAVYGNDGTKLISYTYDAWGNFTITEHATVLDNVLKNPFTYRGYFYYHELGMYYLGTRWYDPAIGRFISPDSVMSGANGSLHGLNLYAYCFNNPVNMTDASGNWPEWIEAVAGVINKMADSFVKSIEADVGTGVGLGGDVEIFQGTAYRDSYAGYDDGMAVTGNRAVVGGKYFGGLEFTADHRVEENGKLVTDSVSPNDGILDMLNYPDTIRSVSFSYSIFYAEISSEGLDFGLSASASCHVIAGGHARVSFSIPEYFVRVFS